MPLGHQEGYVGYMYLGVSGTVLTNTRTYLQSLGPFFEIFKKIENSKLNGGKNTFRYFTFVTYLLRYDGTRERIKPLINQKHVAYKAPSMFMFFTIPKGTILLIAYKHKPSNNWTSTALRCARSYVLCAWSG